MLEKDFVRDVHIGAQNGREDFQVVYAGYTEIQSGYQITVIEEDPTGSLRFKTGLAYSEMGAIRALELLHPKKSNIGATPQNGQTEPIGNMFGYHFDAGERLNPTLVRHREGATAVYVAYLNTYVPKEDL